MKKENRKMKFIIIFHHFLFDLLFLHFFLYLNIRKSHSLILFSYFFNIFKKWNCGLCIFHVRPHSMVRFALNLFIWWKFDFLIKTWSCHLFLFYFLSEKQNKKEKPQVWLLKEKTGLWKPSLGPRVRLFIGKVR